MKHAPFALAVEGGGDQFTVTDGAPRLSWKVARDTPAQSQYELEARIDGSPANPPMLLSTRRRFATWPWAELRSRSRC